MVTSIATTDARDIHLPLEWRRCMEKLLTDARAPYIVIVIGASDVGKTTFCCALAALAFQLGKRTMIVDADMGQSDIGPPTTIGLGRVTHPITRLSQVQFVAGYFVGSVSPLGHMLPTVVGTRLMVDYAIREGAELVIVDTTGLVRGNIGRELKHRKIELIRPQSVIAIQRQHELRPLLSQWQHFGWLRIFELPAPRGIQLRNRDVRKQYREQRFRQVLRNAYELVLSLEQITILNTWLGTGTPVPDHFLRHLSDIAGVEVLYAERSGNIGILVTDEYFEQRNEHWLRARWGVDEIIAITAERLEGLVVGLHNVKGDFLAIGVLQYFDADSRSLCILTPKSVSENEIAAVAFGRHRIHPDGSEIGSIHPSSL